MHGKLVNQNTKMWEAQKRENNTQHTLVTGDIVRLEKTIAKLQTQKQDSQIQSEENFRVLNEAIDEHSKGIDQILKTYEES